MYPVESKIVIKGEDEFLCHVYNMDNQWHAFVDLISKRGRTWSGGIGTTPDIAIHSAIEDIYEKIND